MRIYFGGSIFVLTKGAKSSSNHYSISQYISIYLPYIEYTPISDGKAALNSFNFPVLRAFSQNILELNSTNSH